MALKSVVELYRTLESPIYNEENRTFECSCRYSNDIKNHLQNIDQSFARIKSLHINGDLINNESLPEVNDKDIINVIITVSSNSPVSFFKDIESFFRRATHTIKNCRLPSEFYLVDDNYFSGDEKTNDKIANLNNLYKLIDCLSKIAEYKESEQLVFFSKIDDKVITLPLKIKLTKELLNCTVELQLFSNLCDDMLDDLLVNEKRIIFKETLFDFSKNKPESESELFFYLIEKFDDFKKLFLHNLKLYLDRFSFQKIRQEVANEEIHFSERCSKTLSDIQAKLLGIPISLAGVIVLAKATSGFEFLLLAVGLAFTSLILFSMIKVQLSNFNIIKSAFKNVFDGFERRYQSYPEELIKMIQKEKVKIEKQQRITFRWLIFFIFLSLVPGILSFIFVILKIYFSSIVLIFIS